MLKRNIIVVAPAYTRSGYGAHSRDIVKALWNSDAFNIRLVGTGWGSTSITEEIDEQTRDILAFCARNMEVDPREAIHMHVGIPNEFEKKGRYNVGVTAGIECESMSKEWVDGCNKMDVVIVPSTFMKRVFLTSGVRSKIVVCPEGVDTGIFNLEESEPSKILDEGFQRHESGETVSIKTDFNLLCVGQWMPYDIFNDRKQIAYTIKTFIDTFRYETNVGLILKVFTHNTDTPDEFVTRRRLTDMLKSYENTDGIPPIYLIHGDISDEEMAAIYKDKRVKGLITLTSGEGWGRSLAEAAACGVPIMAPKYSSYLDFVGEESTLLLPVSLQPVPPYVIRSYKGMFPPNARWAMVPQDKASEGLKKFKHSYNTYKDAAVKYAKEFGEAFSMKEAYKPMVEALLEISPGAVQKANNLKLVKV